MRWGWFSWFSSTGTIEDAVILLLSQKIQRTSLISAKILQYMESCSWLKEAADNGMLCTPWRTTYKAPTADLPGSGAGGQTGHKFHNKEPGVRERKISKNQSRNVGAPSPKAHQELPEMLRNTWPAGPERALNSSNVWAASSPFWGAFCFYWEENRSVRRLRLPEKTK